METFTKFWLVIAIMGVGALVLLYYLDMPLEHYSVSVSLPIDVDSHSGEATYYGVDAVFNADSNIPFGMIERQIASAGTNPNYWMFNPYEISQPLNVTFPTTRSGSLTVTIHYFQKQQYLDGGGSTVTRWVTLPSYTYTVRIDPYREAKYLDFINPLKEMMLLAGALSVAGFIVAGVKTGTELGAQGFIFGAIFATVFAILLTAHLGVTIEKKRGKS